MFSLTQAVAARNRHRSDDLTFALRRQSHSPYALSVTGPLGGPIEKPVQLHPARRTTVEPDHKNSIAALLGLVHLGNMVVVVRYRSLILLDEMLVYDRIRVLVGAMAQVLGHRPRSGCSLSHSMAVVVNPLTQGSRSGVVEGLAFEDT